MLLGLKKRCFGDVGIYEKNGQTVADLSDSYVNYAIGGGWIGFEHEENSTPQPPDLPSRGLKCHCLLTYAYICV